MTLIFATNNQNKINEIQQMIPNLIQIESLESIGCYEDIEENASTIEGNAIIKANFISEKYGVNCFADDSGLEVEALDGEPGVLSARYAGEHKNAADNMDKLLEKLADNSNRNAQFKTVICLNLDGKQQLFTGICKGKIINKKTGNSGFGYDPIFIPNGYQQTFAEMDYSLKNKISHRAIAVQQLIKFLQ